MVPELGLAGGRGFETSPCTLFPICRFESPWRTLFGLFDSPRVGMRPHVREGVKMHDIHIKFKSYKLELLGELVF